MEGSSSVALFIDALSDSFLSISVTKSSNLIVISSDNAKEKEIVSKVLEKCYEKLSVQVEGLNLRQLNSRKISSVLIVIDNLKSFEKFHENLNAKNFHREDFFTILMIDGVESDCDEIFKAFMNKKFFNVNVLIQKLKNLEVFTFLPFRPGKCLDSSPKLNNNFNGELKQWSKPFDFPKKFKNLHKCTLTHALTGYEVLKTSDGSACGPEVEIFNEFGKFLNFKPEHKVIETKGVIYRNGSGTGVLKDLHDEKINATSSSLQLERSEALSWSYPFSSDPWVLIIPPGASFSRFEKLYKTFSCNVWIAVGATLLLAVLFIKLLPKKLRIHFMTRDPRNVCFSMLNIFLGGGLNQSQLPRKIFPRYFLMNFVLYSLVIRAAYVGILYNFLSNDVKHPELSGVDEMMEKDFTFYAYESMMYRIVDFKFYNR